MSVRKADGLHIEIIGAAGHLAADGDIDGLGDKLAISD